MNSNIIPGIASLFEEYERLRIEDSNNLITFQNSSSSTKKRLRHDDITSQSSNSLTTMESTNHDNKSIVEITKRKTRKQKQEEYMSQLDEHEAKVYKYGLVPRILKNDIRRFYPSMFANVYNSCDYNFIKYYMKSYLRDDFKCVLRKMEGNNSFEMHGIPKCSQALFGRVYDSPDVIFQVSDIVIRLRADDTSMVTSKFICRGTRILDNQMVSEVNVEPIEENIEPLDLELNESMEAFIYLNDAESKHTHDEPEPMYVDTISEQSFKNAGIPVSPHSTPPSGLSPRFEPNYSEFFDSLEFANDIIHVESDEAMSYHTASKQFANLLSDSKENAKRTTLINTPLQNPTPIYKHFEFIGSFTLFLDEKCKVYYSQYDISTSIMKVSDSY